MVDTIYLVLIALVVGAVVFANRRRVRSLPVELRVRASSDRNLTGARFHWGPYERRGYVIASTTMTLIVMGGLILFWRDLDSLLKVALLSWTMTFGIILSFSFYYDRCLWTTRAIKVWGLDRIPWNGNVAIWERKMGKMAHPDALAETTDASGYKKAEHTVSYGVAWESPPDGWLTPTPPKDGYIVVAPLISGADAIKSVLSVRGRTQEEESDPRLVGVGMGYLDGYDYYVRGIPKEYLLGRKGLSKTVDDPNIRRMTDGLDPDLRAFIYAHSPLKSKQSWWSVVIFIEEVPEGAGKPALKAPDSTVLLANMDLRAELDETKRNAEETATYYRRQIERMRG